MTTIYVSAIVAKLELGKTRIIGLKIGKMEIAISKKNITQNFFCGQIDLCGNRFKSVNPLKVLTKLLENKYLLTKDLRRI